MSNIDTIEAKPKQRQFSGFVENLYIYNQFYLVGPLVLFLKANHIEDLNSKMFKVWLPWAKIDPLVISFGNIILGFLT